MDIHDHIRIAHDHTSKALDLAYGDEHQSFWTRISIGRAQSILISLITNKKLK
jgi:hypothetical protein